jgi:N-methylhydantoinase A
VADARADFIRTVYCDADRMLSPEVETAYAVLEDQASTWLSEEGLSFVRIRYVRGAEMRYAGQSYEVPVWLDGGGGETRANLLARFHERHHAVYGHSDPAAPVQFIDLRVQVVGEAAKPRLGGVRWRARPLAASPPRRVAWTPSGEAELAVYDRAALAPGRRLGVPCIVEQYDTTIYIPPGFTARVDAHHNVIAERT